MYSIYRLDCNIRWYKRGHLNYYYYQLYDGRVDFDNNGTFVIDVKYDESWVQISRRTVRANKKYVIKRSDIK